VSIVGPKRKYGFDLVAQVGHRYFFDCRNEEEIVSELAEPPYRVPLPTRSLDWLLDQYVWFVATVHGQSRGLLRELFDANGGYVLCVDGTCEADSPVHLLCQDSVTGIVLDSFKIGSENEVEAKRTLAIVQDRFGDPIATMGDMRHALRRARRHTWEGIPHFVCHSHFVADVGRDLLKPYHDELGKLFRRSKLTPKLIDMRRYLGTRIRHFLHEQPLELDALLREAERGNQEGLEAAIASALAGVDAGGESSKESGALAQLDREELSVAILWIQAYASDGRGQGFPFDLPKLAYYRRCVHVYEQVEQWLQTSHPRSRQQRHFEKLHQLLTPIVQGPSFRKAVRDIECVQEDFDRLRSVLRVLPAHGPGGMVHEDAWETLVQVEAREKEAAEFREHLRERAESKSRATDLERTTASIMLTQLDEYWPDLFGHALVTDNGGLLLVDRTNNAQEREHRFSKRCRRRIHGRSSVKHDLERWPAERALVYNLRNPLYVDTVYGSLDAVPERFAEVLGSVAEVRAAAEPEEATVRLTRKRRKQSSTLDHIATIRRLLVPKPKDSKGAGDGEI